MANGSNNTLSLKHSTSDLVALSQKGCRRNWEVLAEKEKKIQKILVGEEI